MTGEAVSHGDILARVASLEARRSERDKALDDRHDADADRMTGIERRLEKMDEKLDGLVATANMGKGALWAALKIGGLVVLVLGAVGWVADRWSKIVKLLAG